MPEPELRLVPLCSARIEVSETLVLANTPTGSRMVGEIGAARFEGERLRASLRGRAAADWLLVTPSGVACVDVRMTLETDDGALLYVVYTGRANLETNLAYAAPTFETGDPRYAWLNGVLCAARGSWLPEERVMSYPQIYELR